MLRYVVPLKPAWMLSPVSNLWVPVLAEGLAIAQPVRGRRLLQAVRESKGTCVMVEEDEIRDARQEMASNGFYIEPTSATAVAALKHVSHLVKPKDTDRHSAYRQRVKRLTKIGLNRIKSYFDPCDLHGRRIMTDALIKFTRGVPPPESFPKEKLAKCAYKVLTENSDIILQYGDSTGIRSTAPADSRRKGNQ